MAAVISQLHNTHGFQIWLRMPKAKMKDDPRYGTVNPDAIPTVPLGPNGSLARVIAGPLGDVVGPAKFAVSVQMLDVELAAGMIHPHEHFCGVWAALIGWSEGYGVRAQVASGSMSGRGRWTT